jgi:hypothetical protein
MFDILTYIPSKRKTSASGWVAFNAPCCVHNGQSRDKRGRGGIKIVDTGWSYHCFNCRFTASFTLGRNLTLKARKLLSWLNVPQEEIEHINLDSMRHRSIEGILSSRKEDTHARQIEFAECQLPRDATLVTPEMPQYWQYLQSRHVPQDYPILTVTSGPQKRPHVIVPFTYGNRMVGYGIRYLDNKQPKFYSEMQPGYVFGLDLQTTEWDCVLVVEGLFDALSISGVGLLHNEISDDQVRLITALNKDPIVVPDQDKAGLALVDRAIELGWAVSIPNWPRGCKDVNDAVKLYGKLGALLTIIEAKETNKIKIEMKRKSLVKRI